MNAYKKDQARKRRSKAVQQTFKKPGKTVADNTPKKPIRINSKTIVLAPMEATTLNIRSRYE